jgi:hypothetical protein
MARVRQTIWMPIFALALATPNAWADTECGHLHGTFMQLTNAQSAWSDADWRRLFDQFEALGVTNLFVQWTVLDRTAFFATSRFKAPIKATLPVILNLAARSGVHVWVGLHLDTRYWEEIKKSPDLLQSYFRGRLQDLKRLLVDLDTGLAGTSFAGWYITDEVDDQTWEDLGKRAVLKQYLSDTVAQLKAKRPASKVAISGFTSSSSDPNLVGAFWADILKTSAIDLLLFQDGVGEGKLALGNVPSYYTSLAAVVHGTGAQLGGVVELFSLMPDGKRLPGPIGRIRNQMAMAERLPDFPPVAFSVPDYMSDLAGRPAADLFSEFVSTRNICPP